jgi:(p)ppGpp synthase/HD superfamily hydrolase
MPPDVDAASPGGTGPTEVRMTHPDRVVLTPDFSHACAFALHLHRDQRRKGGDVPYAAHLLAVAATVLDAGGDEVTAIAAVLHDAVEDHGGIVVAQAIERRYGKRVADLVLAVSDSEGEPKPPWAKRKAAYVARLARAAPAAKLIAAADKLHNLRCTVADVRRQGPGAMLKFNAPAIDIVAYYDACMAAIRDAVPRSLVEELDWTLAELKALLALPGPSSFRLRLV